MQSGLSVQTVRRRLRLRSLTPGLRRAFDRGQLEASVAEAAARLPQVEQEHLERKLAADDKVTLTDVRDVARAQAGTATAALPNELFSDRQLPWQVAARAHLTGALQAIPPDRRDSRLRDLIADALVETERP